MSKGWNLFFAVLFLIFAILSLFYPDSVLTDAIIAIGAIVSALSGFANAKSSLAIRYLFGIAGVMIMGSVIFRLLE